MKKAVIVGERQARVVECPDPVATAGLALVKVHTAPMCTEYKAFLAGQESLYLGHEAAGEVVAVDDTGSGGAAGSVGLAGGDGGASGSAGLAGGLRAGDRVVVMPQYPCGKCALCIAGDYIHCEHNSDPAELSGQTEGWATYAQYVLKPAWLLPRIPDGVSYDDASLSLCALGPSFGAMEAAGVGAFDAVLVSGLGPVGMGAVVNARFRGARVVATDLSPWRRNYAVKALGAELALDPRDADAVRKIREFGGAVHGGEPLGADFAVDCTGVPAAQRACLEAVRRRGSVAFVGESTGGVMLHASPDFIRTGVRLFGAWHYNLNLFPKIMRVVRDSPLLPKLVTHRFGLSEIQKAFETAAAPEHAKILLHPWE